MTEILIQDAWPYLAVSYIFRLSFEKFSNGYFKFYLFLSVLVSRSKSLQMRKDFNITLNKS